MTDKIPQLPAYDELTLDQAFATLAAEAASSAATEDPEAFRLLWLGRKQGRLKLISDAWLKTAPAEARKPLGMQFNDLKQLIESSLDTASTVEVGDALDITLPGTRKNIGIEHPLTRTSREIVAIFQAMGYSVADGP